MELVPVQPDFPLFWKSMATASFASQHNLFRTMWREIMHNHVTVLYFPVLLKRWITTMLFSWRAKSGKSNYPWSKDLLCSSQNVLHRKPRWWWFELFNQIEEHETMNSVRNAPINVKTEGRRVVLATHGHIFVRSVHWVRISIVHEVPSCKYLSPLKLFSSSL